MNVLNDKRLRKKKVGLGRFFSIPFLKKHFSLFIQKLSEHDVFVLAGSFAYTTALALAPFFIIVLSLSVLLGVEAQQGLVDQMSQLLGNEGGNVFKMIAENAQKDSEFSGISGIMSFIVILVSASAIFTQMKDAFDKINETRPEERESGIKGFLRQRIFSVGLVLGFIFLMVVSLIFTAGLALTIGDKEETALIALLAFMVNVIVFSALFTCMFRFIPTEKMRWSRCAIAGFCATIFFLIGKNLIGLYLGKSAVGSSYGAAGALIVLLVWLYYTALTLFISFEFTNVIIFNTLDDISKADAPTR